MTGTVAANVGTANELIKISANAFRSEIARVRLRDMVPPATYSVDAVSAARRSWVVRGVFLGFSEEARTRGFPSPPFGGFGFFNVVIELQYSDSQAVWWIKHRERPREDRTKIHGRLRTSQLAQRDLRITGLHRRC